MSRELFDEGREALETMKSEHFHEETKESMEKWEEQRNWDNYCNPPLTGGFRSEDEEDPYDDLCDVDEWV